MRVVLLVLLMVLLPLRGWTAERMGVYMATSAVLSTMPDDCPMKIAASNDNDTTALLHHKGDRGCQSCQLCMAVTAQSTAVLAATLESITWHPVPCADRFASVDPSRLAKPPIS